MSSRLTLVLAVLLSAQSWGHAERLPIRSYTVVDGLAQNTINRIVRDRRGFLWFCTAEGLSRFDGYEFTNFGTDQGLPHRNITDFLETRGEEHWVGTYGGVVRFDPKGTPKNLARGAREIPMFAAITPIEPAAAKVNVLREGRDGTVWVGTENGLYRLSCGRERCSLIAVDIGIEKQNPAQRSVFDVLEDHRQNLWIATSVGLYRRRNDGEATLYTTRDGLPDDFLHCLLEDRRGQLWVGGRNAGVFRLSETAAPMPRVAEHIVFRTVDGGPITWVFQMMESADDTLWVGTHRGIVEFPLHRRDGRRLRAFGTPQGLTDHEVTALAEDLSGNLWLGTDTAGAMKLVREGFVTYGESDGILGANAIFGDFEGGVCFRANLIGDSQRPVLEGAILHPNRVLDVYWVRFGRFDGERITWLMPGAIKNEQLGWVGERITLRARSGEWWIGTGVGLFRFPAVKFSQLENAQPLALYPTPQVFSLFEDRHGNIWISTTSATMNRLLLWDRATGAVREFSSTAGLPPLTEGPARSFGEDAAGDTWVGLSRGVARYREGRFTVLDQRHGLPSGGVNHIHRDRSGRLWMALSAGGVVRIDQPEAERPRFRNYTTAEGLSSNFAIVLTEDLQGRIYVGTGRGLDQLDPETGRIRHFTTDDGLAPGRIFSAHCDESGTVWIGASKGISRFVPAHQEPSAPPNILLTGVSVAGSPRILSALGERETALSRLPASQNQLQFRFTAPNFAAGQRLSYQYKLEGTSTSDWSAPIAERSVNYAKLAPGRYRFSVRAVNSDGMASVRPATMAFTILPPLWQRWWFTSLTVVILALLAYAAYRYRVRRILEVANVRARIATDLHDDIGANLTRIAILSEVEKQQAGEGPSRDRLGSIASISRDSVAAMSDIVWAVNPERDGVVDLTRKMRQHAEEVFSVRDIDLQFKASAIEQNLRVGLDVRRDFLLIFKEAVNNAARHSACSSVGVDFRADGQSLSLEVADDGIGFNPAVASEGQGLTSMRRRAQRLGGTFEVDSRPGHGTTIRLRIPGARGHRLFR